MMGPEYRESRAQQQLGVIESRLHVAEQTCAVVVEQMRLLDKEIASLAGPAHLFLGRFWADPAVHGVPVRAFG
jgi:hypothetical protein